MIRRPRAVVAAVGVGALLVVATGGAASAQDSGEVNISGSSTVEPITSLVAELYAGENPDVKVRVDGPGTGDGFKLFCQGETDVSDASRPIKDEEATACQSGGVEYTELKIGIDGLTLVANKASKLKCVDFAQVYGIFGPESDGTLATAQSVAEELGSTNKALPTGDVKKFTPGPESGTYDSFIEIAYQSTIDDRLAAGKITDTTTDDAGEQVATDPVKSDGQFPNDNDIVRRVEGSKNGIGFFGFAYYEQNAGELKSLAVQNPDTGKCVKPTKKTIQKGTYPLRRDLFIYPNNAKALDNKSVKSFVDFYLTKNGLKDAVSEAGYVPLPKADQKETQSTWSAVG
jgi:phosphate transport system substrate-binding protein